MKDILRKITSTKEYLEYIEYGEARFGHPEGKVKKHIEQLEENLNRLKDKLSEDEIDKLMILIHVHDTFKAVAAEGVPLTHPKSHCNLAKDFLAQYTNDSDLLEITQNHDLNYDLWKQYKKTGSYDKDALIQLLQKIQDINLFLVFTIIDGNTPGKYLDKLPWFINEVKKYRNDVRIDNTWIKPLPTNMPEISL